MILSHRTIERLNNHLNTLREGPDETDTNFAIRVSKKYSRKHSKQSLPCPETGLSIDQIRGILKFSKRIKNGIANPMTYPKISGEFIENLAFLVSKPFEELVLGEKSVDYLPSTYVSFFSLINEITPEQVESDDTVVLENSSFRLYILKLEYGDKLFNKDKVVTKWTGKRERYLSELFSPRNKNEKKEYEDIFILEKRNRLIKYRNKLTLEHGNENAEISMSFIDDRDMNGKFQLFLLQNTTTSKILYSCRTFSETIDVAKEIQGSYSPKLKGYDKEMYQKAKDFGSRLLKTKSDRVFVIDRLTGTIGKDIHLPKGHAKVLLYKTVMKFHLLLGQSRVICLARRTDSNLLLTEYVRFGLVVRGINFYKVGKNPISHWVLFGHLPSIIKESESFRKLKGYISEGLI